jgi:hypothetical protein
VGSAHDSLAEDRNRDKYDGDVLFPRMDITMATEKRSTYVQLKEDLKGAAVAAVVLGRREPFTCRVAVNAGLELLLAGVELLKMHGITKEVALGFVESLFAQPGDIDEMHKGGKNEGLLRVAMKIINGPIVRHSITGEELEGEAGEGTAHDAIFIPRSDPTLN